MLSVAASQVEHAERGDFGAEVREDVLYIPRDVARTIQEMGLRNAEELLSALHSFPSSWMALLGWQLEEVQLARDNLQKTLEGHVDDIYINPPPPPQFGFGAMPPPGTPPEKLRGPPLPPDAPFGK
ncbi:MAG TPA: hypothetical protein VI873_01130 [Candidatus Peribacteraceae bacterium]|nr:hypothetical protein [Candidatus Peribacteraceae bacterium]